MARMRSIQPPHPSEKFTLAEAMRAWRAVDAEHARRAAARRSLPLRVTRGDRPRVAADNGRSD